MTKRNLVKGNPKVIVDIYNLKEYNIYILLKLILKTKQETIELQSNVVYM
jgi:hypothetical protein